MFYEIDKSGSIDGLKQMISKAQDKGAKGLMIFSCDENGFTPIEVDPILKGIEIPIFGGVFPEIIFGNQKFSKGSCLVGFDELTPSVTILENISDKSTDIESEIQSIEDVDFQTIFIYVDAFSTSIETLINELYYEFGLDNNFIGGGSGSLSFEQKPTIFTNRGMLQDAAIIAQIDRAFSIGVKHGWKDLSGPFMVTKSTGNTIEELDYKPAYEVYKKVVEKDCGLELNDGNFFDIAKGYPLGVTKIGTEKVVRDPITVEDQGLVLVGSIKKGDYIYILNGDKNSLVEATQKAFEEASKSFSGEKVNGSIFIDCISRALFLQEQFQEELDAVYINRVELIGALTLGEIANSGKDYLEFYNKTAVVGVF